MAYKFLNNKIKIRASDVCYHDSNIGYESDFTVNGDVSGWELFDGIHTYGCWDGFLFGTLYDSYAMIGRYSVFRPVAAERYNTIKVTMKYDSVNTDEDKIATKGKIKWRTISDPIWDDYKSYEFDINPDGGWHTYVLDMSTEQWWQGDINDLRIYITTDGYPDDTFFIRYIQILSLSHYECTQEDCSYYSNYTKNCGGKGVRSSCLSVKNDIGKLYSIVEKENDYIAININDYGMEYITLDAVNEVSGQEIAADIEYKLSLVNIGGYAEVRVSYDEHGRFIIANGIASTNGPVIVYDSALSRYLGFFDSEGNKVYEYAHGADPANRYKPLCSYRVSSNEMMSMFDVSQKTSITFDPFKYNVEGGRSDWLANGIGTPMTYASNEDKSVPVVSVNYDTINSEDKTIIDYYHPFNASGKINKIYIACTLTGSQGDLTGSKVYILRPRKDGNLGVIHSIDIPPRDNDGTKIYSIHQETVVLDCDLYVNKGDLIGVYNVNMFIGKSLYSGDIDAQYYQVDGQLGSVDFPTGKLNGNGASGLLLYARSNEHQKRLVMDVDLGDRVNIDDVIISGKSSYDSLEYNIASCLDTSWTVDLHGETHKSGYVYSWSPYEEAWFTHNNEAFGVGRLDDGVVVLEDNLAGDSFVSPTSSYYSSDVYVSDPKPGLVTHNSRYFYVNGDCEWIGVFQHAGKSMPMCKDFKHDPISFIMKFPYGKSKKVHKSQIYFKEKWNFRSFALSTFLGENVNNGDSDTEDFMLIPVYSCITMDGYKYINGTDIWEDRMKNYLAKNPCNGFGEFVLKGTARISFGDGALPADHYFDQYGGMTYDAVGKIDNEEEYRLALETDWSTISHEWEPIDTSGFKVYCDYHESTKINEMEVYCLSNNKGSNMVGSFFIDYSNYGDYWSTAEIKDGSEGNVRAYIGMAPEFITITVNPITEMQIKDIIVNVNNSAVYTGDGGNNDVVLLDHNRRSYDNLSKAVTLKNVYGGPYNLTVDLTHQSLAPDKCILYNKMSNAAAMSKSEIGPSIKYYKNPEKSVKNSSDNIAIGCDCYALRSVAEASPTFYSYDGGETWENHGVIENSTVNFTNEVSDMQLTKVYIPNTIRSRFWKIGLLSDELELEVSEIKVKYSGQVYDRDKIAGVYYSNGVGFLDGASSTHANHIINGSVAGSYYTIKKDNHIIIEFNDYEAIDELLIYHKNTAVYNDVIIGIDKYTVLNIKASTTAQGQDIYDYSYRESKVTVNGPVEVVPDTMHGAKSVKFNGTGECYLSVPSTDDNYIDDNKYTIDCNIKFNSLPSEGNYVVIAKAWDDDIPSIEDGDTAFVHSSEDKSWAWIVRNIDGEYYIQAYVSYYPSTTNTSTMYYRRAIHLKRDLVIGEWYTFALRPYTVHGAVMLVYDTSFYSNSIYVAKFTKSNGDIVIGKSLDGCIEDFRVTVGKSSHSYPYYGCRYLSNKTSDKAMPFSRNYSISLYVSDNGASYGKFADVDTEYESKYSKYDNRSSFSAPFKTLFAVDFGNRYNVDFMRSYGDVSSTWVIDDMLSGTNDIDASKFLLSNVESSDPAVALSTIEATVEDTRWLIFNMDNGAAGTNSFIDKLDVYSNISVYNAPGGGYNNNWEYIGKSITNYYSEQGLIDGITVTASSTFYSMHSDFIVDGYIGESIDNVWGSINEESPSLLFDLGDIYSIYMIQLFHGIDSGPSLSSIIKDYTLSVSEDNVSYTTVFNKTANTSKHVIHEITTPVNARYIRMSISKYMSEPVPVLTSEGYRYFRGAMLRGIKVFQDYGYGIVSSEEMPIIAVNLNDQFYIDGTSSIGKLAESEGDEWSIDTNNLCFSDSVLSEPKKVSFSSWGDSVSYAQWVVVRELECNCYPIGSSNNKYMKHLVINSNSVGTICDYYWWWESYNSVLSNSYEYVVGPSVRSLCVQYQGHDVDRVYFKEGDSFGKDESASWRDSLSFSWYIDNVDNIDNDYGYFFYGGKGGSPEVDVVYKWHISSISAGLVSGWNYMSLQFRDADAIDFLTLEGQEYDPSTVDCIDFSKIGMEYKGVGNQLTMYIDGFTIKRDDFLTESRFNKGLYLCQNEYAECLLGDLSLSKGTIEFWLNTDYDASGRDYYGNFKHRTIFHMSNVDNDVFGMLINLQGIVIYYGNAGKDFASYVINNVVIEPDSLLHVGVVFSNTGENIDDYGTTIKFYLNNIHIASVKDAWDVSDNKHFKFTMGGKSLSAAKESSGQEVNGSIDGVVSDFRVYNYCKSNFNGSMHGAYSTEGTNKSLIEISTDNLTFYKVGDEELPFKFSQVPDGDEVVIYVKSNIPRELKDNRNRTEGLSINWEVSV